MLSSAVSLPPVGELTTLRSDIDGAVADAGVPDLNAMTAPSALVPPSPHEIETPTFSQRPTSPFALHAGAESSGG